MFSVARHLEKQAKKGKYEERREGLELPHIKILYKAFINKKKYIVNYIVPICSFFSPDTCTVNM